MSANMMFWDPLWAPKIIIFHCKNKGLALGSSKSIDKTRCFVSCRFLSLSWCSRGRPVPTNKHLISSNETLQSKRHALQSIFVLLIVSFMDRSKDPAGVLKGPKVLQNGFRSPKIVRNDLKICQTSIEKQRKT